MARLVPEMPELTLETPYGTLAVMPQSDTRVHLDHADPEGLSVEGSKVVLAGWWLDHGEEGWRLFEHEAMTYPDRGRHDPELQARLAGEIEKLFESWRLTHSPELRQARQVYLTNEANRLGQGIPAAEQKLVESRARLAVLEAELGPELSALESPPSVTEPVASRHDLGH